MVATMPIMAMSEQGLLVIGIVLDALETAQSAVS